MAGWLDTLSGWLGTGADIAQDVGQIASPFLSWDIFNRQRDAIDDYTGSLQQGAQQGQQAAEYPAPRRHFFGGPLFRSLFPAEPVVEDRVDHRTER